MRARCLTGVIADETFFAFLAHADVGDDTTPDDDPFATRTHRKANPNYGVSVKPEDLKALATKAKHMPSALASFKQKRLNVWTSAATPWLNLERWKAGQSAWDPGELRGLPCWGGVDLSSKTDLSAFVLVFPPDDGRASWRLLPWFFTPEDGLAERAHQARAPYQRWVDDEHLTTNNGNRIDQEVIRPPSWRRPGSTSSASGLTRGISGTWRRTSWPSSGKTAWSRCPRTSRN